MDLQSFITQALTQIAGGIEQAGKELKNSSAKVNPKGISPLTKDDKKIYGYYDDTESETDKRRVVEEIQFDVAVYATESTETGAKIGLMVGTIGLGAHGKSEAASSSQSRIKFRIPMVLPNPE